MEQENLFKAKRGPQIFAALAANFGAFGLGTVNGWTSPALPDLEESGELGFLSTDQQSWIGSLVSLACFFAVYPSGYFIQKFGRKSTMIVISLPFVAGWLLMAFASGVEMLYIGRIMTGLCSGTFSIAAPVYIAETAEVDIRGALGSGFQLMVVAGILFAYVVGAFVSWSWLALICVAPSLICVLMLVFAPESPRYLLFKGKYIEAEKSLLWLRGAQNLSQIKTEFSLIQESVREHQENAPKFKELFKSSILKPTIVSVALLVFQQFSGIDAVTFYTVQIFQDAGTDIDPNISTIIFGSVQVVFNLIALYLVERVGRRKMLISTNVILAISLASLGVFFYLLENNPESTESIGWLPLASLIVYAASFSLGIGPIAWLMVGEVLPNHVIGIASALATSSLWILSFFITRFFENLSEAIGKAGCFWGFSIATILGIFIVQFFVPETKGKTLEEIQEFFNQPKKSKLFKI